MLKKCAILGVAVLLVGGLALGWLVRETRSEQAETRRLRTKYAIQPEEYLNKYGRWHLLSPEEQTRLALDMEKDRQSKTRQQFTEEQQARLRVDIEKLAAGQVSSGEISDFLYGSGWEEEVGKYKKLQEKKEIAHTTSIVCISVGGTILGGCCIIWLMYVLARLARAIRDWRRSRSEEPTLPPSEAPELAEIPVEEAAEVPSVAPGEPTNKSRSLASIPPANNPSPSSPEGLHDEGFLPRTLGTHTSTRRPTLLVRKAPDDNPTAILMSDAPSNQDWSPDMQWSVSAVRDASEDIVQAPQLSHPSAVSTLEREERTPDMPKGPKQQATREQSEPLSSTLKDLAQQVSAIRDYAASQQDRVEKLQDGYDWGIIRTFCLRVIRCLDNVEKRIDDLGPDDEATALLEEIRDELLFALESSGVERFAPDVDSDYRGMEKLAEAVKEKQASSKPGHTGRIAKVLRPGYRYMINDDNFKIVRTAQVKLFD